ncbi:MAG TPA: hypothetical protein VFF90_12205, partial [Saprospiraceae bacterium]|nr:hypothetical protein [Saprospiraceae bacterium]
QDANCAITLNPPVGTFTTVYNASYDLVAMICPGDSLLVNGSVYNKNHLFGTEILTGASVYGCDSLVNVVLSIYPPAESYWHSTLCFGSSITINGTVYNELHPSGTDTLDHADIHGCDSIVHVQLSFDSIAAGNLTSTICAGDSIVINGFLYHETNATGVQSFPGGSVFGCDSILNIDLHFHPPADYILKDTLCPGESVVINGTVFDINHPEGVDIITNGSHFGCDSSIRVSLIFYPLAAFTIIDTLASGDSLVVNGTVYNQFKSSGLDTIPGGSNKGCDSIIQIELYFRESISAIVKVTAPICYGDSSGLITLEDI